MGGAGVGTRTHDCPWCIYAVDVRDEPANHVQSSWQQGDHWCVVPSPVPSAFMILMSAAYAPRSMSIKPKLICHRLPCRQSVNPFVQLPPRHWAASSTASLLEVCIPAVEILVDGLVRRNALLSMALHVRQAAATLDDFEVCGASCTEPLVRMLSRECDLHVQLPVLQCLVCM
jgi:hypothetical protein